MSVVDKTITPIAYIRSDFPEKFGIPRQSGLIHTQSEIVFEPAFRSAEAVRGLEEFSHLWLIWGFSGNEGKNWHPTVRPPRLGGNARVGVFASRSPFRPNGLGLSCVRLLSVISSPENSNSTNDTQTNVFPKDFPLIVVEGADLMDGTPIYDIKPYIPYADCQPDARGGYTDTVPRQLLQVICPDELLSMLPGEKQEGLMDLLAQDPRPSYQNDPDRVYGLSYAGFNVQFFVRDSILTVVEISIISGTDPRFPNQQW